MPKQVGSLSAVVVSGGKQYRVSPGDRILVDRIEAEPGAEVRLERVLLVSDAGEVRVGTPVVEGFSLAARVIGHERGPRIEVLRYKSKKHVRVHRGARADLTALEILEPGAGREEKKAEAKTEPEAKAKAPRRARAATAPEAAPAPAVEAEAAPRRRRAAKKEDQPDGS